MDRGTWWLIVHGVQFAESDITEQLTLSLSTRIQLYFFYLSVILRKFGAGKLSWRRCTLNSHYRKVVEELSCLAD